MVAFHLRLALEVVGAVQDQRDRKLGTTVDAVAQGPTDEHLREADGSHGPHAADCYGHGHSSDAGGHDDDDDDDDDVAALMQAVAAHGRPLTSLCRDFTGETASSRSSHPQGGNMAMPTTTTAATTTAVAKRKNLEAALRGYVQALRSRKFRSLSLFH